MELELLLINVLGKLWYNMGSNAQGKVVLLQIFYRLD